MKCPICGPNDLHRAQLDGVEIDICHTCGGVWLDQGELESVLDRHCDVPADVRPA